MSDVLMSQPATDSSVAYEAAVDELLREMQVLNEMMDRDRTEIERLTIETRMLKAETQRLGAESRAALSRLMEML